CETVRVPAGDCVHFRLFHASWGNGRRAETNSPCLHGWKRIKGNGVLVDGKPGAIERLFRVVPSDAAGVNFDKKKMVVRAAGNHAEPALCDAGGESSGIFRNLLLIFLEARLGGFL